MSIIIIPYKCVYKIVSIYFILSDRTRLIIIITFVKSLTIIFVDNSYSVDNVETVVSMLL